MSDATACSKTLERYIKARIPIISVRTTERGRALDLLRDIIRNLNMPGFVHTLSQGTRDLLTNKAANEDRSVAGALDFASQQISQRQLLTFVLTEVADIEDDTPTSRQFQDVIMLGAEKSACLVLITSKPVWSQLQRLGMTVTLDVPTEDEMWQIINEFISSYRSQRVIEWTETEEREAATILQGISRIEAENVIATLLAKDKIVKADLGELVHAKDSIFSDISGVERVRLDGSELAVGGLDGLKSWLERKRPLLTADLRERGIRPPRGCLLVGVPGCGKSLSAKAISASWNLPLYRLDLANIHGQYLGQSEGRLKDALSSADHVAPCVLWIDEIEKGLAGAGQGSSDGGTSTRLVGHFLYWLQEARSRVFVVATANDVSRLPPELLRRGRFDELFFVDLPTPEERKAIIGIYWKRGIGGDIDTSLMEELVTISDGFSGADLESAVKEVTEEAFLKGNAAVNPELFRRSFRNVVPLSKTNPEKIEEIRGWGRDRAVPASGQPIGQAEPQSRSRRTVLV